MIIRPLHYRKGRPIQDDRRYNKSKVNSGCHENDESGSLIGLLSRSCVDSYLYTLETYWMTSDWGLRVACVFIIPSSSPEKPDRERERKEGRMKKQKKFLSRPSASTAQPPLKPKLGHQSVNSSRWKQSASQAQSCTTTQQRARAFTFFCSFFFSLPTLSFVCSTQQAVAANPTLQWSCPTVHLRSRTVFLHCKTYPFRLPIFLFFVPSGLPGESK